MIKMVRVKSSNVSRVGHDGLSELLIQFGDGNFVYRYTGVPVALYEEMLEAESIGKFISKNIKNSYAYQKMSMNEAVSLFTLTGDIPKELKKESSDA